MTLISTDIDKLGVMISSLKEVAGSVGGVEIKNLKSSDIDLDSFEKYLECIEELNAAFDVFEEFLTKDSQGLHAVRGKVESDDVALSKTISGGGGSGSSGKPNISDFSRTNKYRTSAT